MKRLVEKTESGWHGELPMDVWREILQYVHDTQTLQHLLGVSRSLCLTVLPFCCQALAVGVATMVTPQRLTTRGTALRRLCYNLATGHEKRAREELTALFLWAETPEEVADAMSLLRLAEDEHAAKDGAITEPYDYQEVMDSHPLIDLWYDGDDGPTLLRNLAELRVVSRLGSHITWSHWLSLACSLPGVDVCELALLQFGGPRPLYFDAILRALGTSLLPLAPQAGDEWSDCCVRTPDGWVSVLGHKAQAFRRRVFVWTRQQQYEQTRDERLRAARLQRYRLRNMERVRQRIKAYSETPEADVFSSAIPDRDAQ